MSIFPWINFFWYSYLTRDKLWRIRWILILHDLAVYAKKALPFSRDLSLEKLASFTYFSVLIFSLYQSSSFSLCTVFNASLSKIDEVSSINPSNVHHKNWLNCFGGIDIAGELFLIFYLKWPYLDCQLSFSNPWLCFWWSWPLNLVISSDAITYSTEAFNLLRNSDHVAVSVFTDLL